MALLVKTVTSASNVGFISALIIIDLLSSLLPLLLRTLNKFLVLVQNLQTPELHLLLLLLARPRARSLLFKLLLLSPRTRPKTSRKIRVLTSRLLLLKEISHLRHQSLKATKRNQALPLLEKSLSSLR
jgi:hypothetical protein